MLKQVRSVSQPWVAIIDHSIDIGTKKALVVLRVHLDVLSNKQKAIQLKDCECIGLKVSEIVNGDSIALDLKAIFNKAGAPTAIIKDCDRTLQKGVHLWSAEQDAAIPVIEDIGHVMASALKAQFEKTDDYKCFTALTSNGAKKLRQTQLAFLNPPKLRTKGRFQNVGKLGKWAERLLSVIGIIGPAPKDSTLAKLRLAFPGLCLLRPFIQCFADTAKCLDKVMAILKNKGLDANTYEQCKLLSKALPRDSKVEKRLLLWLEQHFVIQQQITSLPLLVSSDIIESLFGHFKHIIERSPQADMNRTTLLIPALCGQPDQKIIAQAFSAASHADLKIWEQENIVYTMRRKRQAFLAEYNIQIPAD